MDCVANLFLNYGVNIIRGNGNESRKIQRVKGKL